MEVVYLYHWDEGGAGLAWSRCFGWSDGSGRRVTGLFERGGGEKKDAEKSGEGLKRWSREHDRVVVLVFRSSSAHRARVTTGSDPSL